MQPELPPVLSLLLVMLCSRVCVCVRSVGHAGSFMGPLNACYTAIYVCCHFTSF